jgi:tetratricopeptide (TPR) repeat protein
MLSAGIQGQSDAAQMARQIDIFRTLQHASTAPLPPGDPKAPIQLMLTSMMDGTMGQHIPLFLARHAYATDPEWKKAMETNAAAGSIVRVIAQRAQLPTAVMRDVTLGNAKITCEGDDAHGYRATLTSLGAANQDLFVSRDDGQFRIVADGNDSAEVGNYALYLLKSNRETEARSLLDWKRDLVHRGGGDDPLEGNLFARFWNPSSSTAGNSGPDAIPIAAIALTIQKPSSQVPLDPALAAYKAAPTNTDLVLLLASAYLNHEDGASARTYTDKLVAEYPDSMTAIMLAGRADMLLHDLAAWSNLLNPRLAKRPTDHGLLFQSAYEAEAESDFPRARKVLQQIVDSGKATSVDYNNLAWLGLFEDHVDAASINAGQQATSLNKNSFDDMHTLACLYAAQGKTSEARQLLLDGMAAANLAEPNSAVWFGFGSIYEQFGANDAAIAAYRKVTRPETTIVDPVDTWVLAQARLKSLQAN